MSANRERHDELIALCGEDLATDLLWTTTLDDRGPEPTGPFRALGPGDARPNLPPVVSKPAGSAGSVLGEVLGEGGMGIVNLSWQSRLERPVAVKRLHADAPAGAVQALLREARNLARLEHPNIVPVHALGLDESGSPTVVMRRLNGDSWGDLIDRGEDASWGDEAGWSDQPFGRHVEVLLEVSKALQYAHSQGLLHCDLKPENVIVGAIGEVYVLDWGLAWPFRHRPSGPRRLVGTPGYIAPEMLDQNAQLTPATDVYLLGACLYEALTGYPPHSGGTLKEVLSAAGRSAPPRFGREVPPELAAICTKAMRRRPTDRYPDILSLRAALRGYLSHRSAARLADAAAVRLSRLRIRVQTEPTDPEIPARFSEARFAYREALAHWPENPTACRELRQLLALEVCWRLSIGDGRGASEAADWLEAFNGRSEPVLRDEIRRVGQLESTPRRQAERIGRTPTRERVALLSVAVALLALGGLALFWLPARADVCFALGALALVGAFRNAGRRQAAERPARSTPAPRVYQP